MMGTEWDTKYVGSNFNIFYPMTKIHKFQYWQVDFNFQDSAVFGGLIFTMRVHWITCHFEEMFAEYKLKWSHMVYFQTRK